MQPLLHPLPARYNLADDLLDRNLLPGADAPGAKRAWAAFERMMRSGPPPVHAAAALRRALLRNRSATVRTGRFFQAVAGPLLARLAPLALSRRIQARYFGLD